MRILHPISEDEMVAVFLGAEVDSDRYGEKLRAMLARGGHDEDLLRRPDVHDAVENGYRRRLLDDHRAYARRDEMFGGFPRRVEWFRAALTPAEVLDVLYIDWDWWLELSGGSRRPPDAARRIRAGEITADTDLATHERVAEALRRSPPPPELIAVTTHERTRLVLVEGHVRLTAYALFPDYLPPELEVLLGISEEVALWWAF